MTRLLAILAALSVAAPHWGPKRETASELLRLERRYRVAAELIIADAEHESRWHELAVNPSSGTVGLMQILPRDPAQRERLFDWRTNLQVGVADFAAARRYCQSHGHGGLARDWLNLPTGWDAVRHSRCGFRDGRRLPVPAGIAWLLQRTASLRHAQTD